MKTLESKIREIVDMHAEDFEDNGILHRSLHTLNYQENREKLINRAVKEIMAAFKEEK